MHVTRNAHVRHCVIEYALSPFKHETMLLVGCDSNCELCGCSVRYVSILLHDYCPVRKTQVSHPHIRLGRFCENKVIIFFLGITKLDKEKTNVLGENRSREYSKGNETVPGKVATTHTEDGHKQIT